MIATLTTLRNVIGEVDSAELGPQLHIHRSTATNKRKVDAVKNRSFPHCKPFGGLWTSTYDARYGSGWVQWCISESFCDPKGGVWDGTVLTPEPGHRIAIVQDEDDLRRLIERYPHEDKSFSYRRIEIDWSALARDYDGLHLTEDGQWNTRLSEPHNLYGWDCESTLWFRWCFSKGEHITARFETKP